MALREVLAKFGIDVDDSKLKKGNASVDSFKRTLEGLGKALAVGAIIQGVRGFVSEMTDLNSQLDNTSQALGISYDDLQRWNTAAKYVDVSAESLAAGMKFLQKNAADAGGEASKVFADLGISARDASGKVKPTSALMREVGLAIAGMQDPAERTAAVLKVFGKQGLALIPMFAQGADGLDTLLGKLDDLGGGITEDARIALSEIEEAQKDLDVSTLSLKAHLAAQLLPTLTLLVNGVTKGVVWFQKIAKETNIVKSTFIVLTGAILVMQRATIATGIKSALAWAPLLLALLALILVVDEVVTTLEGGDSLISRFAKDHPFVQQMIDDLRALIKATGEATKLGGVESGVEEVFSSVGASIVRFVVDDIPEFFSLLGSQVWGAIVEQLSPIKEKIIRWFSTGFEGMATLGSEMMRALGEGIRSAIDVPVSAIADLGAAIKAKLKSVFGWNSPPKMTLDLGHDLTAKGLVGGLDRGRGAVEAAIQRDMGADLIRGLGASGAPQGARTVQIHSEVNQTIQAGSGASGIRDAARTGAVAGLGDLNAELAALEPVV